MNGESEIDFLALHVLLSQAAAQPWPGTLSLLEHGCMQFWNELDQSRTALDLKQLQHV
jgi:hypothetical protein